MKKALQFLKLDFVTIKPYLTVKNLVLFCGISLFMSYNMGNGMLAMGVLAFYSSFLFLSYPFAVGEQNGIDTLYATLSIGRGTVVVGRYLYALCLNSAGILLGAAVGLASDFFTGHTIVWGVYLVTAAVLFFLISAMQGVQLPVYFALGYTKAKVLIYLPFLLVALGGVLLNVLLPKSFLQGLIGIFSWMGAHLALMAALFVAAYIAMMGISILVSRRLYQKRDF